MEKLRNLFCSDSICSWLFSVPSFWPGRAPGGCHAPPRWSPTASGYPAAPCTQQLAQTKGIANPGLVRSVRRALYRKLECFLVVPTLPLCTYYSSKDVIPVYKIRFNTQNTKHVGTQFPILNKKKSVLGKNKEFIKYH